MIKITMQERKMTCVYFQIFFTSERSSVAGGPQAKGVCVCPSLDPDFYPSDVADWAGAPWLGASYWATHARFVLKHKRELYWHIVFQRAEGDVITRQERNKASYKIVRSKPALLTFILFSVFDRDRGRVGGEGARGRGAWRPGGGRSATLVTSGYDRMIMIIIINIVIPFQQVFILPTTATEEASWCSLCLYFALHIYFSLPAGDQVGRGRSAIVTRR